MSQQFFSHVWTFFLVELVLSNEDEVSCSRTQRRAPGEIRTRNLAITGTHGAPEILNSSNLTA